MALESHGISVTFHSTPTAELSAGCTISVRRMGKANSFA
jgi:hypothetical protein